MDPETNKRSATARATIHYSKNGAHIVPSRPRRRWHAVSRRRERETVWVLNAYSKEYPDALLRFEFAGGEAYICSFDSAYESGNWYELDEGIDTVEDEYYELAYKIEKTIEGGPHCFSESDFLDINCRNFSTRITDVKSGKTVFSSNSITS